jgi:hypothetical protein
MVMRTVAIYLHAANSFWVSLNVKPNFSCFIYPRGINILHIQVTYGNVFDSSIGVFDRGDRCENSVGKDQERRAKNRSAARGDQEP